MACEPRALNIVVTSYAVEGGTKMRISARETAGVPNPRCVEGMQGMQEQQVTWGAVAAGARKEV